MIRSTSMQLLGGQLIGNQALGIALMSYDDLLGMINNELRATGDLVLPDLRAVHLDQVGTGSSNSGTSRSSLLPGGAPNPRRASLLPIRPRSSKMKAIQKLAEGG
jgi:hypothetical protein